MDARRMMQMKAVADFYDGLSAEDKLLFAQMFGHLTYEASNEDNAQLDRIEQAVTRNKKFFVGVGENVVGNALYDVGVVVLRKLLRGFLR